MFLSTKDNSLLPVIGFSLKGITNTSDSFLIFFTGEEGAAGAEELEEKRR